MQLIMMCQYGHIDLTAAWCKSKGRQESEGTNQRKSNLQQNKQKSYLPIPKPHNPTEAKHLTHYCLPIHLPPLPVWTDNYERMTSPPERSYAWGYLFYLPNCGVGPTAKKAGPAGLEEEALSNESTPSRAIARFLGSKEVHRGQQHLLPRKRAAPSGCSLS